MENMKLFLEKCNYYLSDYTDFLIFRHIKIKVMNIVNISKSTHMSYVLLPRLFKKCLNKLLSKGNSIKFSFFDIVEMVGYYLHYF